MLAFFAAFDAARSERAARCYAAFRFFSHEADDIARRPLLFAFVLSLMVTRQLLPCRCCCRARAAPDEDDAYAFAAPCLCRPRELYAMLLPAFHLHFD